MQKLQDDRLSSSMEAQLKSARKFHARVSGSSYPMPPRPLILPPGRPWHVKIIVKCSLHQYHLHDLDFKSKEKCSRLQSARHSSPSHISGKWIAGTEQHFYLVLDSTYSSQLEGHGSVRKIHYEQAPWHHSHSGRFVGSYSPADRCRNTACKF